MNYSRMKAFKILTSHTPSHMEEQMKTGTIGPPLHDSPPPENILHKDKNVFLSYILIGQDFRILLKVFVSNQSQFYCCTNQSNESDCDSYNRWQVLSSPDDSPETVEGKTSVRFLISTWGWVLLPSGFCPGTVGVSAWGGSGHKERSMAQLVAETSMARSCRIWTLMDFRERHKDGCYRKSSTMMFNFHLLSICIQYRIYLSLVFFNTLF